MSLLANSGKLADIFSIIENIFIVLLSTSCSACESAKLSLESLMSDISSFKEDTLKACSLDITKNNGNEEIEDESVVDTGESDYRVSGSFPRKEETYLQQAKKSIYYKKCLEIFNQISKSCKMMMMK